MLESAMPQRVTPLLSNSRRPTPMCPLVRVAQTVCTASTRCFRRPHQSEVKLHIWMLEVHRRHTKILQPWILIHLDAEWELG